MHFETIYSYPFTRSIELAVGQSGPSCIPLDTKLGFIVSSITSLEPYVQIPFLSRPDQSEDAPIPPFTYNSIPPRTVHPKTIAPTIMGDRSRGRGPPTAALFFVEPAPVATAVTDPEPGAAVPVDVPLPPAS
jgi:hypothetical protein